MLRPRGWKKALHLLREWSVLATTATVIVALLAVVLTLIALVLTQWNAANNRLVADSVFQSKTTDHLKGIDEQIIALRVLISANQPSRPQNQAAAKQVIAEAKAQSIRVPADAVKQAGMRFIEAAGSDQKAWNVAVDFVNYASENTPWRDEVYKRIEAANYPSCLSRLPADSGVSVSDDRKTLTFHGPVVYEHCVMQIDDPAMASKVRALPGGLIFRRALIKYSGGEVLVPGQYEFCVFLFVPQKPPSPTGLLIAEGIVSSPQRVTQQ